MYEFVNNGGEKKYYIKFRTYHFFGLFKMWWYVLHDTPFGLMYRPFYSMESVDRFIANKLGEYSGMYSKMLNG